MNIMKKIIVSILAILLVVGVACTTYATEGNIMSEIEEMLQQENGNVSKNEATEQIPEGTNNTNTQLNTNANTNTNTNTNKNTNINENLPETTPHAGLENYTGLVFVAIFAVAAIYAYKKVREYNA